MAPIVAAIQRQTKSVPNEAIRIGQRALLAALMIGAAFLVPDGGELLLSAMSEAYLAVSVFVAGTLVLVLGAERAFKTDLGIWLDRNVRWQVPAAVMLGAFPGCGGAIIAVTQYTRGYLSFGSVVATLTATMGDAMFLLLAREPQTALLVLSVSMVVGVTTGYAVDAIHGSSFLRPASARRDCPATGAAMKGDDSSDNGLWELLWIVLMVPGVIIGLLAAFQLDADGWFSETLGIAPAFWLGVGGAGLSLIMWITRDGGLSGLTGEQTDCGNKPLGFAQSVIANTNFITAWVVFAFAAYELLVAASGIDLGRLFAVWAPLVPAAAVLVGFVPGCGPQIMVTSLYLSGAVPLSAQMGNAIANDGDALFPALAVAPRAALVATIYSAIPAVIVAYGWYWLVE
jgi:hypothetical protein